MEYDLTWRSNFTTNWATRKGSDRLENCHISRSDKDDLCMDEDEKLD